MVKKKALCLLLITAFFISPTLLSQTDVSEFEKRLAKISEEINGLKAKMEAEEKKEQTILSNLENIGFKKRLIKKEISLFNIQLEKTTKELNALKEKIRPLKQKLDKEKQSIEKTLVTIFKFGKLNFLEFMLRAKDIKVFLSESKNLSLLAQYQDKIIAEYMTTYNKLMEAEEQLEIKNQETSQLIQKARGKKSELDVQEKNNRTLIKRIENNKKTFLQAIKEQEERAAQLQTLMDKILKEEIIFPFSFIPLYEKKGELPWPLEGDIVTTFGVKRNLRFNTRTKSNGIEISPRKKDTVIKSVHSGKVAFADYFKGYGNLIIIDHGLTYYTLYGHCSEFFIEKGDMINAEQPIAIVGDFGSLKGVTLYFEIRHKVKPENPLNWLERKR